MSFKSIRKLTDREGIFKRDHSTLTDAELAELFRVNETWTVVPLSGGTKNIVVRFSERGFYSEDILSFPQNSVLKLLSKGFQFDEIDKVIPPDGIEYDSYFIRFVHQETGIITLVGYPFFQDLTALENHEGNTFLQSHHYSFHLTDTESGAGRHVRDVMPNEPTAWSRQELRLYCRAAVGLFKLFGLTIGQEQAYQYCGEIAYGHEVQMRKNTEEWKTINQQGLLI
jgi:hypothetical protein